MPISAPNKCIQLTAIALGRQDCSDFGTLFFNSSSVQRQLMQALCAQKWIEFKNRIMKIDIDKLTEQELIELNHKIVERIKFLQSMRVHSNMMEFSIGEKVSFSPSRSVTLFGTIAKYNKKTVTIFTDEGEKWNVPPSLLSKIEAKKKKGDKSDNVIEYKSKG